MAESAVRQQALRLVEESQKITFGGAGHLKQGAAVAAAILDLADAVRELARTQR